jgi:hypothetical protein
VLEAEGVRVELSPEVVAFETRLPADVSGADFPGGSVYVETTVTEALKAEGAARDLVRRVQETRKLAGFAMNAMVRTTVAAPAEFVDMVRPRAAEIAEATRSARFSFSDKAEGDTVREWDLEGTTLVVGVRLDGPDLVATGLVSADAAPAKAPKHAKGAPKKAAKRTAKKAPAPRKAPGKKAPARKAPAKKPAKKAPAKAAKKTPAKKPAKGAAKKASGKKAAKKGARKR